MKCRRTLTRLIAALVFFAVCSETRSDISYTADPDVVFDGDVIIPAELGLTSGPNLLHSFDQFSIFKDASATFTGPNSIESIVARVTGNLPSQIDGLLRSEIVDADLFLLNPNGILFSENASVDIDGSLFLSTANALLFQDGSQLTVSETGRSVLTTAPPSAFGFNATPAPIQFQNSIIDVGVGKGISLIGGDVSISESVIRASEGWLDIVALAGDTEVALDPGSRSVAPGTELGDVTISNAMEIADDLEKQSLLEERLGSPFFFDLDVRGDAGGDITVLADAIDLDSAVITASSSGSGRGGNVVIDGTALSIRQGSTIAANGRGSGDGGQLEFELTGLLVDASDISAVSLTEGNAGAIHVFADQIDIVNGATLDVRTSSGAENGGQINLSGDTLTLDGASWLIVASSEGSLGSGGIVNLDLDHIFMTNGAIISALSTAGDGGDIVMSGAELEVGSGVVLSAATLDPSPGQGGNIQLDFDDVTVTGGAVLSTVAFGSGASGDIDIDAAGLVIDGSTFTTVSVTSGAAGDITLSAGSLTISGSAFVEASSFSPDDAGDISLSGGVLLVEGANTWLAAETDSGPGNAGNIHIDFTDVRVTGGVNVSTRAFGNGDSGDIDVRADQLLIDASTFATASVALGSSGNIALSAENLTISGGAQVRTASFSLDDAGDINLSGGVLLVEGNTTALVTETESGPGSAGNIRVDFTEVRITDGASVSTRAWGEGDSGDIHVRADQLLIDASTFTAAAIFSGGSGDITLSADSLTISGDALIGASSVSPEDAGTIHLSGGVLLLDGDSTLSTTAYSGGNAGNVYIGFDQVTVTNDANVSTSSYGGNGGDIDVQANQLVIDGSAHFWTVSDSSTSGDITLSASHLTISGDATVDASAYPEGDSGDINLSGGVLLVNGESWLLAETDSGNAGNIHLDFADATIADAARISTQALGPGDSGGIEAQADRLLIDASTLITVSQTSGNSGDITLSANDLSIAGAASLQAGSETGGAGGYIVLSGTSISISDAAKVNVASSSPDHAGNVLIDAESVVVSNLSSISAESFSGGGTGQIEVRSSTLELDNSVITADSWDETAAGIIDIEADDVHMIDSIIDADSHDLGDGGRITITGDRFTAIGGFVSVETELGGTGGSISLEVTDIDLLGGWLVASARGTGDGGSIAITSEAMTMEDNAWLAASGGGVGVGGDILLTVDELSMITNSTIRVGSLEEGEGSAGSIAINGNRLSMVRADISAYSLQGNGGSIALNIDQIEMSDFSSLSVPTLTETSDAFAGSISITGNSLVLDRFSYLGASTNGGGDGGDISINMDSILLAGSSWISSTAGSTGDAGNIRIVADEMSLEGGWVQTETSGSGRSGELVMEVGNLQMSDFAYVSASSLGPGDAGALIITGSSLSLSGSNIAAEAKDLGSGGDLTIDVDSVRLTDFSNISVSSVGDGNAGTLEIKGNSLTAEGLSYVKAETSGVGGGGDLVIEVENIHLDDANVSVSTSGEGVAGSLTIKGHSLLLENRSWVEAETFSDTANGGYLTIEVGSLQMNGASISVSSHGDGDAGGISLKSDDISLNHSSIESETVFGGDGGNVVIGFTGVLDLKNNSRISSDSFDLNRSGAHAGALFISGNKLNLDDSTLSSASIGGDAGNVSVMLTDSLNLHNNSNIETDASESGGGNIDIGVVNLIRLDNSVIIASASGEEADDTGGNIAIDPVFLTLKNSSIVATATAGDGGAIFLTADNFIADTSSIIDASSERGNDGEVTITSPDSSVSGSIGTLTVQFVEQESLLRESCVARILKNRSSLVVEHRHRTSPMPFEYSKWNGPMVLKQPDC